ncbi:MAG TPA: FAD-dependent oxidoreductase [Candidatus Elarobacter sp.]|nr:FAD-dependent oxidoreductase [Candidatus Elarobacter sp.]
MRAHDVVVLGGGPAGAAVARALALRGRDVIVLEATSFEGPRFGETLPPECNPLLRELGVWDALVASGAVESPGTISAWGASEPDETDFVANRYGSGWHVDRNAFDALLCEAAARAGASVRTGARVLRCVRGDDGSGATWRFELGDASGDVLAARFAVDASGRNGFRLGPEGGRVVDDALVAIFLRVAHDGVPPADSRTLVEAAPDGWWYCAPLPSGETVAAFITDPELYASEGVGLGDQLAQAPLARARIGSSRIAASHVVHVPSSVRARAAGDGWAAAGDAAAAYDPLSGYGITKALRDARPLADAVDRALRGDGGALDTYADGVRRAFDAYAVQRRAYYALERRWPERPFWKKRVARR